MTIETNNYKYEIYNLSNELYPTIVISKKQKQFLKKILLKRFLQVKKLIILK